MRPIRAMLRRAIRSRSKSLSRIEQRSAPGLGRRQVNTTAATARLPRFPQQNGCRNSAELLRAVGPIASISECRLLLRFKNFAARQQPNPMAMPANAGTSGVHQQWDVRRTEKNRRERPTSDIGLSQGPGWHRRLRCGRRDAGGTRPAASPAVVKLGPYRVNVGAVFDQG